MNTHVEVVPRATQKDATFSVDVQNPNSKALTLVVDVTDEDLGGGAGSLTVSILGLDPTTGKTWTLLAGAAVVTISTNVYRVGPSLTAAPNAVANAYVPKNLRITFTHGNANPMLYGAGLSLEGN